MLTHPVDPTSRRSLHAVAEHVLAAARHRAVGRIGLRPVPGGFGTPPFAVDGAGDRTVDVVVTAEDVVLVVTDASGARRSPLTSLAAAAAAAGLDVPGGPADVYTLSTPCEPDAPLTVDRAAAAALADWFATVDAALRGLGGDEPVLWPEHFDLGVSLDEVNYGGSAGDGYLDEPYAYVGPWSPREGDFWNAPFGAARPATDLADAAALVAFLEEGRRRATADPA